MRFRFFKNFIKIKVNGMYNGVHGNSHRARIPNIHNFTFISTDSKGFKNSQYVLNMKEGLINKCFYLDFFYKCYNSFFHYYKVLLLSNWKTATLLLSAEFLLINIIIVFWSLILLLIEKIRPVQMVYSHLLNIR